MRSAAGVEAVERQRGHGLKGRNGEGGDDGDGDGGGEAATGRMITDESASGLEVACAAACGTCSWRELHNLWSRSIRLPLPKTSGPKGLQAVEYILLVPPNECVPQDKKRSMLYALYGETTKFVTCEDKIAVAECGGTQPNWLEL